ncbi:MAG: class I SAM-dependent DNA methyltransferase [Thermodesulfobacteriota bacterium]|nr:class I SAM-dependent DNA methyltransferase [Thermodesulfobacteriota bacterium]
MNHTTHNKIVSFIWAIADDCLRDIFVRGKYRDVILPMFILRRLDCLLEPRKDEVLEEVRFQQQEVGLTSMEPEGLYEASGHLFYNVSRFTLKSLLGNPSQLEANFSNYLDGFSENVKEIITHFDLRSQARKMAQANILHDVIEKFTSEEVNVGPHDTTAPDGRKLEGLSNLGMGYVFEELIRRFNEDNNEEAGEHFTPREVIDLMTHILFLPVKDKLPNPLTVYDPACGSGGMLTESQDFIIDRQGQIAASVDVYLYGKECQGETYAICKSDMMIKGNNPENIRFGSTLAMDEFSAVRFDFMLSNPPYGKSWKTDLKFIKDGKEVVDPRFQVTLKDYWGAAHLEDATPRSSDGQLLFLKEMVGKMKRTGDSPLGSRIASVHNGSSLFTGDAGSGESNIRRHVIENDWLEAVIQLPTDLFYNTGITTYIWILSNNKSPARQGKVQLIDASSYFAKLRKNLGKKNCKLTSRHIEQIINLYDEMVENDHSRVFQNNDFGYYKVTIARPLRLAAQFSPERIAGLRFLPALAEEMNWAYEQFGDGIYSDLKLHQKAIEDYLEAEGINLKAKQKKALFTSKTWNDQLELLTIAGQLMDKIGQEQFLDFNLFKKRVAAACKKLDITLPAPARKKILTAMSRQDEKAEKVIKKVHKLKGDKLAGRLEYLNTSPEYLPDFGLYPVGNKNEYLEYEQDSNLKDNESIPLDENIHAYFRREVRPHVTEAWIQLDKTRIGYEISFNKYFYKHQPLRSLEEVTRDILKLEQETDGLLKKLVRFGGGLS